MRLRVVRCWVCEVACVCGFVGLCVYEFVFACVLVDESVDLCVYLGSYVCLWMWVCC